MYASPGDLRIQARRYGARVDKSTPIEEIETSKDTKMVPSFSFFLFHFL